MWKVDIYLKKNTRWSWRHAIRELGAAEHQTQTGRKWVLSVEDNQKNYIERYLKRYRFNYKWYKSEWSRSSHYRATFTKNNPGPYHCRYCNRLIKKENMYVDHLIPIAKVKTSTNARMLLYLSGIKNVNDVRNLVPSCWRCNQKKGNKIGFWYIKGKLGKYKSYWLLRKAFYLFMFAGIIIGVYACYTHQFDISHLLHSILSSFFKKSIYAFNHIVNVE